MKSKFFGLIPARSGSRGLPNKNILEIEGSSLLQRAVNCSVGVPQIRQTFVSSDSQAYLDSISSNSQGVVRILRSAGAASSSSTAAEVVFDLLDQRQELIESDYIVYLQPTSPLRTSHHVEEAIQVIESTSAKSLVSVVTSDQHPQKALKIDKGGYLAPFRADFSLPTSNRQQLEVSIHPNGAIYIFRIADFLELGDIPVAGALPYEMNQRDSLDIDSAEDFTYLEYVVKNVVL